MPFPAQALIPGFPNPLHMLAAWRERRYVTACCQELLALYHHVAAEQPGLKGEALYRQLLQVRLAGDEQAVEDVLHGALVSYALWPIERELVFRDVVHYLAVAGYCQLRGLTHGQTRGQTHGLQRDGQRWLSSNVVSVIDEAIPAGL